MGRLTTVSGQRMEVEEYSVRSLTQLKDVELEF